MEVDEEIYNELRRTEQRFYCLVSHGVENWDEYDAKRFINSHFFIVYS